MRHKTEKGFALVMAVFLLVAMSFIAYGLVRILMRQQDVSALSYRQIQAYYIAYSALERAAYSALYEADIVTNLEDEGDFRIYFNSTFQHDHTEGGEALTLYQFYAKAATFDPSGAVSIANIENAVQRELTAMVVKVN